jgi:DNA polymerase I-like protein with 3'-5' exonuclease and polymerase domains
MSKIAGTIAADGYARIGLGSFWTRTGRNQPFGEDRVFLPSLPQWLHGLIKPPNGWACVELDWVAQEVAIAAALSGDQNMIADYLRGDCHTAFAIRSGLITDETTPEERSIIRNKQAKPVVLGSNYGMSPYGIQHKTKRSWGWAKHIHRQHREVYRQFHSWLDDVVTQARFDQKIESVFGWPCFVGADTGTRSLMNYSSQAGGADMMRHAAIVATEMGIVVNCPVHDSFRIMAPIEDLARTIKLMEEIMRAAGAAITGSFEVPVEVKTPVCYPERQADVFHPDKDRGHRMWTEIHARLASGELPKIKDLDEDDDEEEATQAS